MLKEKSPDRGTVAFSSDLSRVIKSQTGWQVYRNHYSKQSQKQILWTWVRIPSPKLLKAV